MTKKLPQVKFNGNEPKDMALTAVIPASLTGTKIAFPHRYMKQIDTGVEVVVPDGYKLCYSLVQNLQDRGMVATSAPGNIRGGKISVYVLNCGREIVEIKDGDPLVDVWLEQDVFFEWEKIE